MGHTGNIYNNSLLCYNVTSKYLCIGVYRDNNQYLIMCNSFNMYYQI